MTRLNRRKGVRTSSMTLKETAKAQATICAILWVVVCSNEAKSEKYTRNVLSNAAIYDAMTAVLMLDVISNTTYCPYSNRF